MNTRRFSIGIISALFAASLAAGARADLGGPSNPTAPLAQNGSAFTYQGQLRKSGAPVNASCNASFSLFDAATGGVQVGGTVASPTLQVANGLFTLPLDFGWNFNGEARWLETAIGCGEAQATLSPRTALRPAPYAFALPGLYTRPNATSPNIIGGYNENFISSTVVGSVIGGGGSSGAINRVLGSYGTVGGGISNTASGNSAFVGGGGYALPFFGPPIPIVAGNLATGAGATIGGGLGNVASGEGATIGGGGFDGHVVGGNQASGPGSTIGGGSGNIATGANAAIAGGLSNTASNNWASVGGGGYNTASGTYATIPGGSGNTADRTYSFAAGFRANAKHDGAFVWADSTNANLYSSGNDQFIARANGGFAFVTATTDFTPTIAPGVFITTSTGASLSTAGVWTANGVKFPDGKTQTGAAATPANIVIVAKSGGHFSTISAALTSITDNSAANRYLVYVAPGTYTETVTMKSFVDIEGAGELATKITQVGSASDTGTVVGASNAELRYLTVENTGGSTYATAIYNNNSSPRFSHVTVSVSPGVETNGIKSSTASPILADVMISVTGGGRGLNNGYSSLRLTNVSIGASVGIDNYESSLSINSSAIGVSGTGIGIGNQSGSGAFTVTINNSIISGSSNTILNDPGYATFIGVSQLSGGAVGGGGTVTCVGVYDENYASAGYTTCP